MEKEKRLVCGLVSRLMDYPGEDIVNWAAGIEQTVKGIPNGSKERLLDFLSYLKKTPLVALQEEYTRTFDHNPSLCLNLTFHKWGDDKKRSFALVELIRTYRDAGYEVSGVELPDYLPMVLEFISVCPDDAIFPLYEEYGDHLALMVSRLRVMQSPYAKLFEVLDSVWRR
ncbi:MAG: nitrate reductase molybdenum cofactor assembly chaperone [Syntrophobacteraceae bacterium]|jgi:nitrate reductase delta subunit